MASALWQRYEGVTVDGKYRLLRLLGSGDTGGVFEAEPLGIEQVLKHVALKLNEPATGREEQQLQEISGLAGLANPSLLRSFTPGVFSIDGIRLLYLPMEIADESLHARISTQLLSIDEVKDVGTALATALVFLHEQYRPLVHRDVKPGNTLRVGARWKLGDFGLLRSVSSRAGVRTRSLLGTADYAPPESYDGLISPAWDVWSLGVLLHEAISGRHPFQNADTPQQLMRSVCSDDPAISEELPDSFRDLLKRCLDKDPAVRWTAERVLEALEELDTDSGHHAPAHSHVSRRRQPAGGTVAAESNNYLSADNTTALKDRIIVSPSGDGDCTSVVEAVRRAANGATIMVRPGHYLGSVVVQRPLEILGDGAAAEIVIEEIGREALVIDTPGVRVRGLTIMSRSDIHQPKHHGVTIRTGPAFIEQCEISCSSLACVAILSDAREVSLVACTIHNGKTAGVLFEEGSGGKLAECTLSANFGPAVHIKPGGECEVTSCHVIEGRESGILIDRAAACSIQSCVIRDNQGAGILLLESGSAAISSCTIYANKHAGIAARAHSKATITDCDIYSNVLSGATFSGGESNLVRCNFHDSRSNGLSVSDSAECTLEESDVSNNGFAGIKVSHGGVIHVRASRLNDGKRNAAVIQDNARADFTDCEIHGNGMVGIQVEEGGTADIVECRLHDSDEGSIAVSGSATINSCDLVDNGKSAIEIMHGGSATIRTCNLSTNRMPAILVHGKSEAVIEHCRMIRNEMPAIAVGESSKALISQCIIQHGAQVGIVFWDRSKGIVDRCEISECGMDGLRIMQASEPVISGGRIHSNGQYGVHVSGQSAGEITDCDLTANAAGPAFVEAGCTTSSSGNTV